MRTSGVLWR